MGPMGPGPNEWAQMGPGPGPNERASIDCPYGICCPWVRGGWDLDALGKFFRRRRRPRPLLFRQILEQNHIL